MNTLSTTIGSLLLALSLTACGGGGSPTVPEQPTAPEPTPTTPEPTPTTPAPTPSVQRAVVSITFDDGWKSAIDNGIPLFNNAGYPVTAYVITHYLDGLYGYITRNDVLNLVAKGNEIGAHSQTHPCLSSIQLPTPTGWSHDAECLNAGYVPHGGTIANAAAQEQEIRGSYEDIKQLTGKAPSSFAYPYGDYNSQTIETLRSVGFSSGRTVNSWDSLTNDASTDRYQLFSRSVENNGESDDELAALIIGDINKAIATGKWYILCLHRVDDPDPANRQTNISSAVLRRVVAHLQQTGVAVKTVEQVVANQP